MLLTTIIRRFSQLLGVVAPAQGGLPTGGAAGAFLKKSSTTDYDFTTATIATSDISGFGSYLTALTGDVTASGPGSAAATVARLQGRDVATTTPTDGYVLTWVASTSKWTPVAASGGGGSSAGSDGDIQAGDGAGGFVATPENWDGGEILTQTGTTPERRLAQDSTHYLALRRDASSNTATITNTVFKPGGDPYSLGFNGTSSQVAPASPIFPAGDFTISAWVKLAAGASGNYCGIVTQDGVTAQFRVWNTGVLAAIVNGGSWWTAATALSTGTWYHAAFSFAYSSGTMKLYLDGSLDGTFTSTPTYSGSASALIGNGGGGPMNGLIDDFRVYHSVLSGGDIATLATGGEAGVAPDLWYKFNEGTGSTATDSAGSNNGVITAGTWSTAVPPQNPGPGTSTLVASRPFQSEDGNSFGEAGVHTFGDPAGRTVIRAGTRIDLGLPNGTQALADAGSNLTLGNGSLSTIATDGFPYIPTCAGAPTGTPTAKSGMVPLVFDSTAKKLYIHDGSTWQPFNHD